MYPSQLAQLLEFNIVNKFPTMITGQPGVGKTDIVKGVVNKLKNHSIMITHPVVSDPTDYKGMPFVVNGLAEFLPFGDLKKLVDAEAPLVYFLDDLGQASPAVQAAAMQLLLERRINGHQVSEHVVFVAATNRHSDRAGVSGILEPVKSRFATIVNLDVSTDDWVEWARVSDMPHELISFTRFKPKHLLDGFVATKELTNSPTPRTVANVGKLMAKGLPKELEFEVFKGAAGEAFATEFMAYLKVSRELPDPQKVLENPTGAIIPKAIDQQFAMCGAIAAIVNNDTFENFIKYIKRLEITFNIMALRDAIAMKPFLTANPAFIPWAREFQPTLMKAQ